MTAPGAQFRLENGRGRKVMVGVVDSGWDSGVQDPRVLPGRGILEEDRGSTEDLAGHGTLCALRVLQVAPEARVVPVKVFPSRMETSVPRLCEGIRVACDLGAKVVNLSLATRLPEAIRPLFEVCEEARINGVVIVAAAHNQGVPAVPAYLEPVLSVEEGYQTDLLDFSYNPDGPIECTAAGARVPVTATNGWSKHRAGSSIAASTMSGIVARLLEGYPTDLDGVRAMLDEICLRAKVAET